MNLRADVQEIAERWGIDFFGVADLAVAHDAILAQGGPMVAEYPRAISMGIELSHAIVSQLPRRAERAVAVSYRSHAYDVINQRLDMVASQVSGFLQKQGHDAMPIPASKRVDDEGLCAVFSHKLAAHLAGLGWIGKSCLLVTPEAGPRVRWTTVLTDAPLEVAEERLDVRCGTCTRCVEICPVGAFTGQAFRDDEPREARYDATKCNRYFADMKEKDAETAVCGLCLYVCPYRKK
jgi:epoxyqueuosine reductase